MYHKNSAPLPNKTGDSSSSEYESCGRMMLTLSSSSSTSEDEDDDEETDSDDEDEMEEEVTRRKNAAVRSASVPSSKVDNSNINYKDEESMMWFGTEDGHIHVYNCTDNIRIRKNKEKFAHGSSVLDIIYNEDKVFAALANGNVIVYMRNGEGRWNKSHTKVISVGENGFPVKKMVVVQEGRKIWCATKNVVKIVDTFSLEIEVNHY